jgi:ribosome-associated translation inhibitor RaiA
MATSSASAFPAQVPRPTRRAAGRTGPDLTPLHVRARDLEIDPALRAHLDRRARRELGKFAPHIGRITVRFRDVNGPRGGIDQSCEIKLVLDRMPSVLVAKRATTPRAAFDLAAASAERTLRRQIARTGTRAPRDSRKRAASTTGAARVESAATPQRSTARRNLKQNLAGMTSALEDSAQDRPSRKSTRGSANRALRDSNLRLRQLRRKRSPKRQATRHAVEQG